MILDFDKCQAWKKESDMRILFGDGGAAPTLDAFVRPTAPSDPPSALTEKAFSAAIAAMRDDPAPWFRRAWRVD